MTFEQFCAAMTQLATNLPSQLGALTPRRLDFYWQGIQDLPEEFQLRAFVRAANECKFFPTRAELRELAGIIDNSPDDMALIAWRQVQETIDAIGTDESVKFEDAITTAVIQAMGNWADLTRGRTAKDFNTWTKKEFCDLYSCYFRTHTFSCEYLPGSRELDGELICSRGKLIPPKIHFISATGYRPLLVSGKGQPQLPGNTEVVSKVQKMIEGIGKKL